MEETERDGGFKEEKGTQGEADNGVERWEGEGKIMEKCEET